MYQWYARGGRSPYTTRSAEVGVVPLGPCARSLCLSWKVEAIKFSLFPQSHQKTSPNHIFPSSLLDLERNTTMINPLLVAFCVKHMPHIICGRANAASEMAIPAADTCGYATTCGWHVKIGDQPQQTRSALGELTLTLCRGAWGRDETAQWPPTPEALISASHCLVWSRIGGLVVKGGGPYLPSRTRGSDPKPTKAYAITPPQQRRRNNNKHADMFFKEQRQVGTSTPPKGQKAQA